MHPRGRWVGCDNSLSQRHDASTLLLVSCRPRLHPTPKMITVALVSLAVDL